MPNTCAPNCLSLWRFKPLHVDMVRICGVWSICFCVLFGIVVRGTFDTSNRSEFFPAAPGNNDVTGSYRVVELM